MILSFQIFQKFFLFILDSSDLKSTFRGRELRGTEIEVPKNYVGKF